MADFRRQFRIKQSALREFPSKVLLDQGTEEVAIFLSPGERGDIVGDHVTRTGQAL